MKAVYKTVAKKIAVSVYVCKSTGDEYAGQLFFAPEDWKTFMEEHGQWSFVAR